MAEPVQAAVLTSWKEIARYVGRGVRTVQRWEQDFGFPVRRPFGSRKKAILARRSDIDSWVAIRCSTADRCSRPPAELPNLQSRASLAAELETFRMLRLEQAELRAELGAAVRSLHESIALYKNMYPGQADSNGSENSRADRPG